jgi:hypothetical protein
MNVSSLSFDKPGSLPGAGQSVRVFCADAAGRASRANVERVASASACLIHGRFNGAS